jgi:uncharacterized protein (DUF697 family)
MTPDQEGKCHAIIHTAAVAAGAGNVVPIPGLGVAADVVAMTAMATSLATVFGSSITQEVAKGLAVTALKDTVLKQPIKVIAKELSKLLWFLGPLVAPAISVGIIEAAGWTLANEMDRNANE